MIKFSITTLIAILFGCTVWAQNLTSSPYSMYGLGQPESNEGGQTAGMGGLGTAISGDKFINLANPASLTGLDSLRFYFDVGVSIRSFDYKSTSNTESRIEGNFTRFAIGFKPMKRWGLSAGYIPVTTIGYKIKDSQYIEGTTASEDIYFEGSGGVSKLFLSNAYEVSPSLSVGINASYLLGSIFHDEIQNSLTIEEKSYTNSFYSDFGLIYKERINPKMPLNVGLTYGYSQKMKLKNKLNIIENDGYMIKEESLRNTYGYLPEFFSLGILSGYGEKWTFGVDYIHQDWSKNNSNSSIVTFTDMHLLVMGAELIPKPRNATNLFEAINYRLGFSIENSIYRVRNVNPIIYKGSVGLGIPLRNNSMLNLAISYERDNASGKNNIQTSALKFNLGLAFSEIWFLKSKIK